MKIDMHVHCKFSGDNGTEPEETIVEAIKRGLDGLVFTDHDVFEEGIDIIKSLQEKYAKWLTIFRGTEYSTEMSHTLAYGVTSGIDIVNAPIATALKAIAHYGGIGVVAHPYRWGMGKATALVNGVHVIEGFNGHNSPKENVLAMTLASQHGFKIIGGSDSHSPDTVGRAYTEFFDTVTESNLVAVLKSGRYRIHADNYYQDLWEVGSQHNIPDIIMDEAA